MGNCCGSDRPYMQYKYAPIAKSINQLKARYDVIVIGSGYGGAVAASRAARAGQKVCILEKGREWLPGDFPETMDETVKEICLIKYEDKKVLGHPSSLYQFNITKDITVMTSCGLGGSSLTDEGVSLDCKSKVFYDPVWPQIFREDFETFKTIDRSRAQEMLRPCPYPEEYPPLKRMNQMRSAINSINIIDVEDIHETFYRTPLNINFTDLPRNHVGVSQPACNGCGNCLAGCNTGAKNTLVTNYIQDAINYGAEVFVGVEAISLQKDYESYQWQVSYQQTGESDKSEKVVQASFVFICAGPLGSTKILMQSREREFEVSDQLGKKFCGNGGLFGVSFRGKEQSFATGLRTGMYKRGKLPKGASQPPGPAVSSFIDIRKKRGGFMLQDVTVAGAFLPPYVVGSALSSGAMRKPEPFPHGQQWIQMLKSIGQNGVDNTLGLYCMTPDEADGEVAYEKETRQVYVKWNNDHHQRFYFSARTGLEEAIGSLGGNMGLSPKWSAQLGSDAITKHPLGGCAMGESGHYGVVDHMGRVFIGNTEDTYDGLFVVDSSIIPCALGANPSFTITCLAERCMRLIAENERWTIDYTLGVKGKGDQASTAL